MTDSPQHDPEFALLATLDRMMHRASRTQSAYAFRTRHPQTAHQYATAVLAERLSSSARATLDSIMGRPGHLRLTSEERETLTTALDVLEHLPEPPAHDETFADEANREARDLDTLAAVAAGLERLKTRAQYETLRDVHTKTHPAPTGAPASAHKTPELTPSDTTD